MNSPYSTEENEAGYIRFLKSEHFVMIALTAISIPMMVHTANLLIRVSYVKNYFYAYFFAAAFDTAMLLFAIKGRKGQAGSMVVIVFFVNIFYFYMDTATKYLSEDLLRLIITTLLSLISPLMLHSFVSFFSDMIQEKSEKMKLIERAYQLEKQLAVANGELQEQKEQFDKVKEALRQAELARVEVKDNARPKQSTVISMIPRVPPARVTQSLSCSLCNRKSENSVSFNYMKKNCKETGCVKDEHMGIVEKDEQAITAS
jgi:hypothetical protein